MYQTNSVCVCVFQLWDLEANKKMADCSGHLSWVQRVQFSPDGSQLLSCSDDQTVRVRSVPNVILICPQLIHDKSVSLADAGRTKHKLDIPLTLAVMGDQQVAHLVCRPPEERLRCRLQ